MDPARSLSVLEGRLYRLAKEVAPIETAVGGILWGALFDVRVVTGVIDWHCGRWVAGKTSSELTLRGRYGNS